MMKKKQGIFCISLDVELYWGIRDKASIQEYGENILGAWKVVPKLLELFKENEIHATWATVGAMVAENSKVLQDFIPTEKPQYKDVNLSPYNGFISRISSFNSDYVFGNQLFKMIKKSENQEIGTHTFTHYYCLEPGQTKASFEADLNASISISKKYGVDLNSFIFPRHQLNTEYIATFSKYGIYCYRGTEKAWYNSPARGEDEGILKRIVRFADYYFPMFSQHCQDISEVNQGDLCMIRASRWLRPYSKKWKKLDFLKIWRIKLQMKYAAKNGKIFHLWFHPHDIGINIDKNFEYLEELIRYYSELHKKFGFESMNFQDIKNYVKNEQCHENFEY